MRAAAAALAMGLALTPVTACGGHAACTAPAGGRCPGPLPITAISLLDGGTRLVIDTLCGGQLRISQSRTRVTLTYLASRVGAGGMSCACVPLHADLAAPVGSRALIDGATGRPLVVDNDHPLCAAAGVATG